jgi:hypothetical protein
MDRYAAGELHVLDILSCMDEPTGLELALCTEQGELRLHVDADMLQTLRAHLDHGYQESAHSGLRQDEAEVPAVLRFLAGTRRPAGC